MWKVCEVKVTYLDLMVGVGWGAHSGGNQEPERTRKNLSHLWLETQPHPLVVTRKKMQLHLIWRKEIIWSRSFHQIRYSKTAWQRNKQTGEESQNYFYVINKWVFDHLKLKKWDKMREISLKTWIFLPVLFARAAHKAQFALTSFGCVN